MKKILTAIMALACTISFSQPVTHSWTAPVGGLAGTDDETKIAVDDVGNIYMIGEFSGAKTFGSTTLTAGGDKDVFVAKFSNAGACLWAIKCSGPVFTTAKAGGITLDNNYNIYITGTYSQSMTISTQTVNAIGQDDIFIARLDNSGNCVWLKSAGFSFFDAAHDIAFDGTGNVYVTGYYQASALFDAIFISSPTQTIDLFLAKYDLTGVALWVQSAGGNGDDEGFAVKTDMTGNPIITGFFSTTATFGTSTNVTSVGYEDFYAAKYNASGVLSWVTRAGGPGHEDGRAMGIDAGNNIYIAGSYSDTAFFGTTQLNDNGYTNVFFTKLTPSGAISYAKRIGGANADAGYDISVEPGGHVYVAGSFNGTATFGTASNGNGATPSLAGTGFDGFVAKYNGTGGPLWAFKIGGPTTDLCKGVAQIGTGKVIAAGNFSGTVSFGSTTLTATSPFRNYVTELSGGTLGLLNNEQYYIAKTYPNPTRSMVSIELPLKLNGSLKCEISGIAGEIIDMEELQISGDNKVEISLTGLSKGVYNIRLFSDSFVSMSKVILE